MTVSEHVAEKLIAAGVTMQQKLIVAVSGGLDSMLLWEVINSLGYANIGVHINYHLRGSDSNADEQLVKDYATKNQLELKVFNADPKIFVGNLQEKARVFRYRKFAEVKAENEAYFVLTAHHFNDDAETLFINLIRGAGLNGVKGIAAFRDEFIRPFLDISKNELTAYANKIGLAWREDKSNASDKYLRNNIRHNLIPALLKADERAEAGLKNTLKTLKAQSGVFKFLLEKYRAEYFALENGLLVLELNEELIKMPQLLYELLLPYGKFKVDNIISAKAETGKMFFSESYILWLDRGRLLLQEKGESDIEETLIFEDTETLNGVVSMSFTRLKEMPKSPDFGVEKAWLDISKLDFPLVLRPWKQGDKFRPFGMKGYKKISDYLVDIKMPLPLKSKALVLESNGNVVWLVGHRIDDRFKVSDKTKIIYLSTLLKQ